jgi:choline dehydrogenase
MLSGIGPADDLKALGIAVVADRAGVGQNLQDHPGIGMLFSSTQPISLLNMETTEALQEYSEAATGPLSSNCIEAGAFVRTRSDLSMPDIQYVFSPMYLSVWSSTLPEMHGFSIFLYILRPQSRGSINLRSTHPFEPPIIQPNCLTNDADIQGLVPSLKLARRLGEAEAFAPFREAEILPGPQVQNDEDWKEFICTYGMTFFHPVGTCKMGSDPLAVVDAELRVHGVEGLRVVDASIMPTLVGGNTNAPTIMIAEKAADLITH